MIDLEILKKTRIIVTHKNPDRPCADGVASALILLDALPHAEVRWLAYNTPEHRDLRAEPGMLFCDMTPPRERVAEFVEAGAVVLDHHAHAKDIVEAFGARGGYADDPGVSGALLALRASGLLITAKFGRPMTRDVALPFAELVGVRDTWLRADPRFREASALSAALAFYPWETLRRASWAERFELFKIGAHLLAHNEERARQLLASAYKVAVGTSGRLALIINGASHDASNVADLAAAEAPEIDIVIAFSYRAEGDRAVRPRRLLDVSLRSRRIDVGAIAKRLGGGGHVGAAGFARGVADDESPYRQIREALIYDALELTGTP